MSSMLSDAEVEFLRDNVYLCMSCYLDKLGFSSSDMIIEETKGDIEQTES